jgi:hypothetical protein
LAHFTKEQAGLDMRRIIPFWLISGGYKWFIICPNMLASIASRDKLPVDAELFRRGNIYI